MEAVNERKETDRTFHITFYADTSFRIPHDIDADDFIALHWSELQDEATRNMREYCDFDLFEIV